MRWLRKPEPSEFLNPAKHLIAMHVANFDALRRSAQNTELHSVFCAELANALESTPARLGRTAVWAKYTGVPAGWQLASKEPCCHS